MRFKRYYLKAVKLFYSPYNDYTKLNEMLNPMENLNASLKNITMSQMNAV